MPGGILWGTDFDVIKNSALEAGKLPDSNISYVEVGVEMGHTACDVINALIAEPTIANRFFYWGVDISPMPTILEEDPNYDHIREPSHVGYRRLQGFGEKIHWCLIDACHCAQCVMRDAILYGNLMVPGGLLLFHDASPRTQGLDPQTYSGLEVVHDMAQAAERGIDVRRALDSGLLGGFDLVQKAPDQERGGVEVYRKR